MRRMKGPTAALGCWNEEEQNEVMPERRHRAAREICPEYGGKKKYPELIRFSQPQQEKRNTQM